MIATLRPSHLLHLAWITAPDRYRYAAENLDWLEASLALVKAFGEQGVSASSAWAVLPSTSSRMAPALEDATPINPVSLYGQCKAAVWMTTEAYAQRYGFSAAWARVFLPYGPGDEPRRLIPSLLAALTAGKPINVTDGSQSSGFRSRGGYRRSARALVGDAGRERGVQCRHRPGHCRAASDPMGSGSFQCAGARPFRLPAQGATTSRRRLSRTWRKSSAYLVGMLQLRSRAGWNDCCGRRARPRRR